MKKSARNILAVFAILFIIIQIIPVSRSNPPVTQSISAPPEIRAILGASCYDCHSNETRWPWYSHVAPASWLLAHDVREGRQSLNFSRWDSYSKESRENFKDRIYEMASQKLMPPAQYLLMHRDAKLDSVKLEMLHEWDEADTADTGRQ